ncbi:MAG TPA: DUF2867 domain-containing protein [Bacteroidaceae bacterium]|nr:DUF2867 domain-containing protein [Bacteroidaceae bacterium]
MKKAIKLDRIPKNSLILNGFGKIDYCDTYKIQISSNDYSVDKITTDIFKPPKWVDNLMKLRNIIVKVFRLKTGGKNDNLIEPHYSVGNKVGYFTVLDRNKNEIIMAENDKHLNFRTSVMVEKDAACSTIYLSTIVQFNNFFGRLYFLPVKPFHRIIIKLLLKQYANEN